jgi:hypothetical protein
VYFYQLQAPVQARAQGRRYRWFGPARVIGVELKNQRRSEDPELPTEGGQPHAYWLRYGPSVILVTGEQLRFASEDELLAAHYLPEEILQVTYYVVETMLISEVMLPNFNFKAQKLMSQPVICSFSPLDFGAAASSSHGTSTAPGLAPARAPAPSALPTPHHTSPRRTAFTTHSISTATTRPT